MHWQVSTKLLEISGIDSKDSSPKTVLPKLSLRNLPAIPPPAAAEPPPAIAATGSAIILIFFKLNAFIFPKELLK